MPAMHAAASHVAKLHTRGGAPQRSSRAAAAALAILVWTASLSLIWSHLRLMWNDEFLSFYSDSLPTLRQVLHVQQYTPISLDPPTYHLLSHLSMQLVGAGPMALRLPALAGFLLCQLCLFLLVRKIAGNRAALFGMALPVLTASFRFSVEGRPYAWLLGLYALALLCWYQAALLPSATSLRRRWLPLLGLFASIALAITSHYFGVLILVPILLGEFVRTLRRQAIDWPVCATLLAGCASVLLILPFQKGLAPYRLHYYITSVSLQPFPAATATSSCRTTASATPCSASLPSRLP